MKTKTLTCRIVRLESRQFSIYVKYHLMYRSEVLEVFYGADSTRLDNKIYAWMNENGFTHINWVGPDWYLGFQRRL